MLHAITLARPAGSVRIANLGHSASHAGEITKVRLLGVADDLKFSRDDGGLSVTLPDTAPGDGAVALRIEGLRGIAWNAA